MESSRLDPAGESQNSAESFLHTCLPVSLQGGERGAWSHRLFPPCLQIEMLSPLEAVASRFREQYKTFAMALDTTRHELPVKSVHLDGDRQLFLGKSWGGCWARGRTSHWCMLAFPVSWVSLSLWVTSQASSQVDCMSPVKWQRLQEASEAGICLGSGPESELH